MIPIDTVDLGNVLIATTTVDPTDPSLIRVWAVLRSADWVLVHEALHLVAEACGRDVTTALMDAIAAERVRPAAPSPPPVNGADFTS